MAEKKHVKDNETSEVVIAKAKDFWTRYSKPVMIACAVIILGVGGYYIYKNYVKGPKETKAVEAMFRAEEYYRLDSVDKALNGDGQYMGLQKLIEKYGGTDAGNLANFYAGVEYIKRDDYDNAIKYLKKFSTSSKPIQARAYKLIADAYADKGQNADALDYYKKAARHFEKDKENSAEYLFNAAYLADRVMKDPKQAIELYKELKQKYPSSTHAADVDNYLAQLGVYSTE
jgi:tetratricopeptide (TPR) repeat protein